MSEPSPSARPRGGRRGTRDDLQRRLSVAVEELVENGRPYAELSVEELADRAGMSRSTFYKYFGDKRGLLHALSDEVRQDFLDAASTLLELPAGASRDDYRAAFRLVFAGYRVHRVAMWTLREEARHDPATTERFEGMMGAFVDAIAAHLGRAWAGRSDASGATPATVAVWLTWMLEDGQARFVARSGDEELDRHATAVADIVWRTVHLGAA